MSPSQQLTIEQVISRAKEAAKQGKVAVARKLYSAVLQHQPRHPIATQGLRELQKELLRYQSVQTQIANPSPDQINTLINLYHSGQMSKAKQACRELLQTYPQSLIVLNALGAVLAGQGQLQPAVQIFDKIIQLKPDDAQVYCNRGNVLTDLGRLEAAVDSYNQAIQLKPDDAEAYSNRGNTLTELGQLKAAMDSYNQAIQLKPNLAGAYSNRSNALIELGQLEAAMDSCNRAIELKPDDAQAYSNRGNALMKLGQLEAAAASYDRVIELRPDDAAAYSNRGNILRGLGQLEEAVASYNRAIELRPDDAAAYSNRGNALRDLGQLKAALTSHDKAIQLKPDCAEVYSNRAVALTELGRLGEAVDSYNRAIELKPDYAEAYSNCGNTLRDLGRLEEAVDSYDKAIQLKPDFAEAYSNRGNALHDLGQLKAAVQLYLQAIRIQPDLQFVWDNLFFTVKALQPSKEVLVDLYKKELSQDVSHSANLAILEYQLDAFTPHTADHSFKNAIKALPAKTEEEVNNPDRPHPATERPPLPEKMIALLHFGRSGTGLLHSLIDNHPEISTLPSIYFSQYFDSTVWQKLIAEGWSRIPGRFVGQFPVLFDASSLYPIPTIGGKFITGLGQKEGMANVGESRDESLVVDRHLFCTELDLLITYYDKLSPMDFFTLVHVAYEKALKNEGEKSTIFYHIHNPDHYAKLNFLRYNPEARIVMMIREPLQSCESWVKRSFDSNDYNKVYTRIMAMLYDIDQIAFRTQDSVGVRLEDLKIHPQETMASLCDWMGIEEQQSLYEATAQGKKWWGDPSSPDYGKKGMSPFEDSPIKRAVGSIFSEKDQFVLRTLFYPFSVRFGYVEEDLAGFTRDLQEIRPLLDEVFDFEKKIVQASKVDLELFMRSGSYRFFRAGLLDRWKVLNEFNDYPHMLTPLEINAELTV